MNFPGKTFFFTIFIALFISVSAASWAQDDTEFDFPFSDEMPVSKDGAVLKAARMALKHHPVQLLNRPHTINILPLAFFDVNRGVSLGARFVLQSSEYSPYKYRLSGQILSSFRGNHSHLVEFDYPDIYKHFGLRVRAQWRRDLRAKYFGLGNESQKEKSVTDEKSENFISEDFYVYKLKNPQLHIHATRFILNDLYFWAGIGLESTTPLRGADPTQSFLTVDKPFGYRGGWGAHLSFKLLFDNRNDDFFPDKGFFTELSFEPNWARVNHQQISDLQYVVRGVTFHRFTLSDEHYVEIGRTGIIFANRLAFETIVGNPPYYAFREISDFRRTGSLGGDSSMRGFENGRFHDKVRMMTFSELRYTYREFEFVSQRFRLIFTGFFDNGRVWPRLSDVVFRGFHHSFGAGAWLNWNDNLALRFDIGRSREGFTQYLRLHTAF